jgi:hypothetical protein
MAKEAFTVAIPNETLRDLKERLKRTRFAPDFANDGWQYGTNLDYLKRLVEYWIDGYDWRRAEREINSFITTRPASRASRSISSTSRARGRARCRSS